LGDTPVEKGEITYNEHHPSRELFPCFTLRLRSWMHLAVRRMEQMDATEENFMDICSMAEAVDWVKKLMYIELENKK
jgi:hypothetical protein